ncbi:enoyl-CoA hydratase-related protein [Xanthobacteraceae bacterium Astr-EGSB]|uniref:enoyl-CoA hydratase-related protein n=1 Tax=Astrobacterium formosum TaxID=3069710 RepID=UPI0027B1F471|nr:enoyl-CoA hydratase-related protein [Xanthobacteraceae bacterium Astr-EGSB]
MDSNLIVEKRNGHAVVTVNRPKVLNALNRSTVLELDATFAALKDDREVGAVILTGAEKAFVAGADISEMVDMSALEARNWSRLGQEVFSRIENFPRPVIAAINGFALGGGCELALACDIRIASAKAKFGQPEVGLGIIPGFAGTQRLTRLIGKSMSKLLVFSGDTIDAEEALRIGLIDKVVAPEELLATAEAIVGRILAKSPLAVAQAKLAIMRGSEMGSEDGYAFEAETFATCFSGPDQKEGMSAFVEKRKPAFRT